MHKSLSLVYTNRRSRMKKKHSTEIFNFFFGSERESVYQGEEQKQARSRGVGSAAAHTNIERK